jgi:phosphoribosylaminoimidazole carboxylase (NCAIR synthetase)
MSLWTPDGERPVQRQSPDDVPTPGDSGPDDAMVASAAAAMGIDPATLSPEDRARLVEIVEQMAEAQQRLAEAAAADVVANHAMGLYEFAAIKLSAATPQIDDARIAIDALAGLVENTADRLGEHGEALTQALTQIQMAFVQVTGGNPADG